MVIDIVKHWRGEVPLIFAFWGNFVSSTLILFLFLSVLGFSAIALALTIAPKLGAIFMFGLYLFGMATLIWQVVGVWRSANRYIKNNQKKLWGICAKVTVILYTLTALPFLKYQLPFIHSVANAILTAPFLFVK